MKRVIQIHGNAGSDFWEHNPDLQFVKELKALKEKYPEKSSDIMWAIFLIEHPKSELALAMTRAEREEHVLDTSVVAKKTWSSALVRNAITVFKRLCMTKGEYAFNVLDKKIDKLLSIIENMDDTDEDLFDKIQEYLKAWANIETLYEKAVTNAHKQQKTRGSSELSESETGEFWATEEF